MRNCTIHSLHHQALPKPDALCSVIRYCVFSFHFPDRIRTTPLKCSLTVGVRWPAGVTFIALPRRSWHSPLCHHRKHRKCHSYWKLPQEALPLWSGEKEFYFSINIILLTRFHFLKMSRLDVLKHLLVLTRQKLNVQTLFLDL